jgi:hypothetical protein
VDDLKFSVRTGCIFVIIIGILLFILLWSAILLAVQGEMSIQTPDLTGFRLWLITADGQRGVGFSTSRRASSEAALGDHCVKTTVQFFFWRSRKPEPAQVYCECYSGFEDSWQYLGACTP